MKQKSWTLTKHHIIPRSVAYDNTDNNIAIVSHIEHDRYHQLFQNKTPVEILFYLTNTFWNGRKEFVDEYLEEMERINK